MNGSDEVALTSPISRCCRTLSVLLDALTNGEKVRRSGYCTISIINPARTLTRAQDTVNALRAPSETGTPPALRSLCTQSIGLSNPTSPRAAFPGSLTAHFANDFVRLAVDNCCAPR